MATTLVQFTILEAHTYKIILPTHVAETIDEEPDLTFNGDCWEVTWGEEDEVLEISKGEEDVEYIECGKFESMTLDDDGEYVCIAVNPLPLIRAMIRTLSVDANADASRLMLDTY